MLDAVTAEVVARNDRDIDWGNAEELLAVLVEQVNLLTLITLRRYTRKGTILPAPLHIKRPWEAGPEKVSIGEMARRAAKG